MNQSGLVVLLGSGETSASIRKVYNWLFERLNPPIHIGILEAPAGFEPNSDRVAGQIADFFKKRLQNFHPRTSVIPVRKRGTPFSPDNSDILTPLLDANVVMMGPGSPTYAVRQLQDSVAWHTLTARHRLGATLIFASAATIASGSLALPVYEIYKVGEDLHWKLGLNLFEACGLSLVFIPHWNNTDGGAELDTSRCYMGQARYQSLAGMIPDDCTIVGIDEHSALVIDPSAATCRVMGNGGVTLIRDGQEKIFPSGQRFEISELGPYQQPDVAKGIPTEIWDHVLNAQRKAQQQAEKESAPSQEVLALLEKRSAARARKDWLGADAIRSEIDARGWNILDTPEGPRLERR
jgi:hypothetical protein